MTLNDLKITPIKCENKANKDECLKEVHYAINDLLYEWQFLYLNTRVINYLTDKLDGFIVQLRDMGKDLKPECRDKWVELGHKVVEYNNVLKQTKVDDNRYNDEKVKKKFVAQYLKVKDRATIDELFKMAQKNKIINDLYQVNLNSFNGMQSEIIDRINSELKL